MDTPAHHPRIGIAVTVVKGDHVLLGLRKAKHGQNTWGTPGGHLESGESWEECAARELLEETGIDFKVGAFRLGHVTNDVFQESGKHYVTLFLVTEHLEGEPATMEPEKCEGWQWFPWDELPNPLMLPIVNALKNGWDPRRP